MRCSHCGYVSFDYLDACKRCGTTFQGARRRSGLPMTTASPEGRHEAQVTLPAAAGVATPVPDVEDQSQKIDALFTDLSDSPSPQFAARSESQEHAHLPFPMDSLSPPALSPSGAAALESTEAEGVGPAKIDHLNNAGFWIRAAAWIADISLLVLPVCIAAILVWATIILGGWLGGEINDQVKDFAAISGAAMFIASGLLYFTLFVGACGQTPGKMLFGLKIVYVNGQEMTYGGACLRSFCWIFSLLLFSVGFLIIAFTRHKRGLHDLLAGTQVIRVQRTN